MYEKSTLRQKFKSAAWSALKHVCVFIFPATVAVSYFGLLFDQRHDLATSIQMAVVAALGWFIVETAIGFACAVFGSQDQSRETSQHK